MHRYNTARFKDELRIVVIKVLIIMAILSLILFLLFVRYLSTDGLILAAIINIPAALFLIATGYANHWFVLYNRYPKKTSHKNIQ